MNEQRSETRLLVPFNITLEWSTGAEVVKSDGMTENVGLKGVLAYLPKSLPNVGDDVVMTISHETAKISVDASVLRLERNPAHPQVALLLKEVTPEWKQNVWEYAREVIANQKPEPYDDWFN